MHGRLRLRGWRDQARLLPLLLPPVHRHTRSAAGAHPPAASPYARRAALQPAARSSNRGSTPNLNLTPALTLTRCGTTSRHRARCARGSSRRPRWRSRALAPTPTPTPTPNPNPNPNPNPDPNPNRTPYPNQVAESGPAKEMADESDDEGGEDQVMG